MRKLDTKHKMDPIVSDLDLMIDYLTHLIIVHTDLMACVTTLLLYAYTIALE